MLFIYNIGQILAHSCTDMKCKPQYVEDAFLRE